MSVFVQSDREKKNRYFYDPGRNIKIHRHTLRMAVVRRCCSMRLS
jgi:hypothetical protein